MRSRKVQRRMRRSELVSCRNLLKHHRHVTMRASKSATHLQLAAFHGDNLRMADPNDRVPGQVPGRYYVDTQCIDCDLCRETAPANFQRNDEEGFSYVYKQPETPEEEMLSKDALDNCPVEAIGNDGV